MREAVSLVPYIVYRAEQGDYSFAINFVQMMQASNDDLADGMYMSVVCSEYGDTPESALRFPNILKRLADEAGKQARQMLPICEDWKIKLLDKGLLLPVKSDIPTLLLSGRFDPITPPSGAERVAAALEHSYHFTFASGTHGQAFTVPCANQLIRAFLDDPSRAPDGACAREASPTFVTPDQLLSLRAMRSGAGVSLMDNVIALATPALAVAIALLILFSAVPFYSVVEIVRVFRRRTVELPEGWRGRLIEAAPWAPVLSGYMLFAFVAVAAASVGGEIARNQMLLLLGAVPVWVKSLTWLLVPYVLALILMTTAMVLLWRHRARSLLGRLYYSLLVLAGWSVLFALFHSRLFGV